MKCKKCGTELEGKQKYCSNCGERVEENSTSEERIEENSTIMDHLMKEVNSKAGNKIWIIGSVLVLLFVVILGVRMIGPFNLPTKRGPLDGQWEVVEAPYEFAESLKDLTIKNNVMHLSIAMDDIEINMKADLYKNGDEYHIDRSTFALETKTNFVPISMLNPPNSKNISKAEFEEGFRKLVEEEVLDYHSFTKREVNKVKKELAPLSKLYLEILQYENGRFIMNVDEAKLDELKALEEKVAERLDVPIENLNESFFEVYDNIRDEYSPFTFTLNEDRYLEIKDQYDHEMILRKK